jgi:hypothetical protein
MDVQNVISELTHIFDELTHTINGHYITHYGVSNEEYDRMYKLVYKIAHNPDSGRVVISSKIGNEPEQEVYQITPEQMSVMTPEMLKGMFS